MSDAAITAVALELDGLAAGEQFLDTSLPSAAPAPVPAIDQDKLETYKRMFAEARETTLDARRRSQVDFDYYDNKQWTSEEIAVLRKRKQPEIWINRIAPAVNGVLGVLEQGQTDPRAYPRTQDDQDAAEVATDSLRYSAERARWQRVKLAAAKDFLIGGTGAVIVEVDEDGDPTPRQIQWEEFFYDPHSRRADYSDARYMGIAKWMYVDAVKQTFGLTGDIDIQGMSTGGQSLAIDDGDEDKPRTMWGDQKRKRVLVVDMYHLEAGEWMNCVFHGGEVLVSERSPYNDERGRPANPIVAQSCYVDRENQRYGIVRAMVPIQDEINMRRSKLLHMVNSRQIRVSVGAFPEVEASVARAEAARPDGVIPMGYEPVQNVDMAAGQAQLLAESKAEIERMGPNPGILGRSGADQSGRAQLIRQQAGLVELQPALGGIEDLELRVYRQMWARIKQFWTDPKWVRVTDDIGAPKFLQVNEPVMGPPQVVMGPNGIPTIQPTVTYQNRPAEMDMDIIIDATPDTANVQAEQFAELVKLAGIYGPQEVPFEDLLEASALPKKRQLIEKRKERTEKAAQDQQGNPALQLEVAERTANIENKQSATELNKAKTLQTQSETVLKAVDTGHKHGQDAAAGQQDGRQPPQG